MSRAYEFFGKLMGKEVVVTLVEKGWGGLTDRRFGILEKIESGFLVLRDKKSDKLSFYQMYSIKAVEEFIDE